MTPDDVPEVLERLRCDDPRCPCAQARKRGFGETHCPAHEDTNPSLSVDVKGGRALINCFAGCEYEAIVEALEDLAVVPQRGGNRKRPGTQTTGLTLGEYAAAKKLPETYLQQLGVAEIRDGGLPAVEIPYHDKSGNVIFRRIRRTMEGANRFRSPRGSKVNLYGLNRLDDAIERGFVLLLEGESDCQTAWFHRWPAVGLPGASQWDDGRYADHLDGLRIYALIEPDHGGATLLKKLSASRLSANICVARLPEVIKDLSELHLLDPDGFDKAIGEAIGRAEPIIAAAPDSSSRTGDTLRALNWKTGRDILDGEPDAAPWILAGLVARGSIAELSAKVKVGKSTFAAGVVKAVVDGDAFLGRTPTVQGPVLWLSEERATTIKALIQRVGIRNAHDVHILEHHTLRGADWPAIVELVRAKAAEVGAVLVIVDTLSVWGGFRDDQENNTGNAMQVMLPLAQVAADGPAVMVLRHDRKSGGSIGDSARGASAISGMVEIILRLSRDDKGHANRRVLEALGRFDDIVPSETIEWSDGQYRSLGSGDMIDRSRARAFILEQLGADREPPLSLADLVNASNGTIKRTTMQNALKEMVAAGAVVERPNGAGSNGRSKGYVLANEGAAV